MTVFAAIVLLIGVMWILIQKNYAREHPRKDDEEIKWEKVPAGLFLLLFFILSMTFVSLSFFQGVFA